MALTINAFDNADALTSAFAGTLISLLEKGIAERGRASLVVSGGRTPLALFKQLSQTDLAWLMSVGLTKMTTPAIQSWCVKT